MGKHDVPPVLRSEPSESANHSEPHLDYDDTAQPDLDTATAEKLVQEQAMVFNSTTEKLKKISKYIKKASKSASKKGSENRRTERSQSRSHQTTHHFGVQSSMNNS